MLLSVDQLRWIERLLVIIIWNIWLFIRLFFSIGRKRERVRRNSTDSFNKKRFSSSCSNRHVWLTDCLCLTVVLCLYMQLLKMKWREEKMFFSLSLSLSLALYFERKRKHVLFIVYVFHQLIVLGENKILLIDFK